MPRTPRLALLSALLLAGSGLAVPACGGGESSGSGGSASSSSGASTSSGVQGSGHYDCSEPSGAFPKLKLTEVAKVNRPMLLLGAPGDARRLFILGQDGKIWVLVDGQLQDTPFLDISKLVHQPSSADERGFLGLAFHPSYADNRRFFVFYTNTNTADGSSGDQVVAEYARSLTDPSVADPGAVDVLFTEPDTQSNHNGGMLAFSPKDGFLYIGMGDGGGANDDHGTFGNGQDLASKWGKILRVDVSTTPYSIPAGNMTTVPAGNPTTGEVVPEIWDYGLRNPWRFSFDACTGDLYIGDVGQDNLEEIDVEPAGQGNKNYGWRLMEGTDDFNPESYDKSGTTLPVAEYDHGLGCSVNGGYVYRGNAIPGLRGTYLYGDYCTGRVWAFRWKDGTKPTPQEITDDLGTGDFPMTSFGQDNNGEIYMTLLDGTVYRIDAE